MAKKKVEKPKREVTKRQLSHWQQQKKRQRIILGLGIFVVVAVLVVTGVGWYISYYQPLHQTVIRVNKTEFNMDYYIKMLKLYGEGWPIYYMDTLADEVVAVIERNELIRKGALDLGIVVSNKEVDEKLAQAKDEIMEVVDRTLGEKILSGREAILSVLERAASDTMFMAELSDDPEHALIGYGLTSEEKAAVSSGDIRRIEAWIGEIEPRHKKWLWARLQQEKW